MVNYPSSTLAGDKHATPTKYESYNPDYFSKLFDIEDKHFWFCARNRAIGRLAEQLLASLDPGYRVLEVGCGTGNVLRVLEQTCKNGSVVGMDLFAEGLTFARQRTKCGLVQGDVGMPPFNTQFDLIGVFDVLEHLPNDTEILHSLSALLAPGGKLLLTVPAHMSLWSYFDIASCHCRRYDLKELSRKLHQAGYSIEYISQYMAAIFPLIWLGRRAAPLFARRTNRKDGHAGRLANSELTVVPVINTILRRILMAETALLARRRRLPVGTSIVAIARKGQ